MEEDENINVQMKIMRYNHEEELHLWKYYYKIINE